MPKRKLGALEKVDADLLVIRKVPWDSNLTKSTAQTSSIKFEETQRERVFSKTCRVFLTGPDLTLKIFGPNTTNMKITGKFSRRRPRQRRIVASSPFET